MPLVEIDGRLVQVGRPKCIGKRVNFGLRDELQAWFAFRIRDAEGENRPTRYLNSLIYRDREALLREDTPRSRMVMRRYREYLRDTGQHDRMAEEEPAANLTPEEERAIAAQDAWAEEIRRESEEPRHVYATLTDVVEQYVVPALGDFADDYDLEAIALDIIEYRADTDTPPDSLVVSEVGEKYFYEFAACHDKTAGEGV